MKNKSESNQSMTSLQKSSTDQINQNHDENKKRKRNFFEKNKKSVPRKNAKGTYQLIPIEDMQKTSFLIKLNTEQLKAIWDIQYKKKNKTKNTTGELGNFVEKDKNNDYYFISWAALKNIISFLKNGDQYLSSTLQQSIRQILLKNSHHAFFQLKVMREKNKDLANYAEKYHIPCARKYGLVEINSLCNALKAQKKPCYKQILDLITNEIQNNQYIMLPEKTNDLAPLNKASINFLLFKPHDSDQDSENNSDLNVLIAENNSDPTSQFEFN